MMLVPATPVSVICCTAFIMLLLSTISTPIVSGIKLATIGTIDFGVFGYCQGSDCSGILLDYGTDELYSEGDDLMLPSSARNFLFVLLIMHPVAAFLALIYFSLAVVAHFHRPAHSPRYLLVLIFFSVPTLIASLLAFLVDVLIFSPYLQWGGWIVLAATILIIVCGVLAFTMRQAMVRRKARRKRDAANLEKNCDNTFKEPKFPSEVEPGSPSLSNMSPAQNSVPEFATFDLQLQKKSEDRTPLNLRNPSVKSTSTVSAQQAPGLPEGRVDNTINSERNIHIESARSPSRGMYESLSPPNGEVVMVPGTSLHYQRSNGSINLDGTGKPRYYGRGRGRYSGYDRGNPPVPVPMTTDGDAAGIRVAAPGLIATESSHHMYREFQRPELRQATPGSIASECSNRTNLEFQRPELRQVQYGQRLRATTPGSVGSEGNNLVRNQFPGQDSQSRVDYAPLVQRNAPIGQAIEMDNSVGTRHMMSPVSLGYHVDSTKNTREGDRYVQGMGELQQHRSESGPQQRNDSASTFSPTSEYSQDGYQPPRAYWTQPVNKSFDATLAATSRSNGVAMLSPIQASPVEPPAQSPASNFQMDQQTHEPRNVICSYYEDVDPRFAVRHGQPIPSQSVNNILPASLIPGSGSRSSTPSISNFRKATRTENGGPHSPGIAVDSNRSLSPLSQTSNQTSVSGRGANNNRLFQQQADGYSGYPRNAQGYFGRNPAA